MGAALFIVLERETTGFDPFVNGKSLSRASDELESLAQSLSVKSLFEFCSIDPEQVEELLDDLEIDDEFPAPAATEWFEASDGLATVRALQGHVSKNPTAVPDTAGVLSDLSEFERVLKFAESHQIRWHLEVDY